VVVVVSRVVVAPLAVVVVAPFTVVVVAPFTVVLVAPFTVVLVLDAGAEVVGRAVGSVVVVVPPVLTSLVTLAITAAGGCKMSGVPCLGGAGRKAMVTSWSFSRRTPDSQSGLQVSSRPPVEPFFV
jgi:hypothetical protein